MLAHSDMSRLLRFGCQNVRSLLDLQNSSYPGAPPRRTAICDLAFRRANAIVVALSESRLANQGSCTEKHYTFFWSGKPDSSPRFGGVGFAVANSTVKFMTGSPNCISSRVISLRIRFNQSVRAITFISVYAPTFLSKQSEKIEFYDDLQRAVDEVAHGDLLIVIGDFNARVGGN